MGYAVLFRRHEAGRGEGKHCISFINFYILKYARNTVLLSELNFGIVQVGDASTIHYQSLQTRFRGILGTQAPCYASAEE